jgi:hypothetical protein
MFAQYLPNISPNQRRINAESTPNQRKINAKPTQTQRKPNQRKINAKSKINESTQNQRMGGTAWEYYFSWKQLALGVLFFTC